MNNKKAFSREVRRKNEFNQELSERVEEFKVELMSSNLEEKSVAFEERMSKERARGLSKQKNPEQWINPIHSEHIRRFKEAFEAGRELSVFNKIPAYSAVLAAILGFFAFFAGSLGLKIIFVIIMILYAALMVMFPIIRGDYRRQAFEKLAKAIAFKEWFLTNSKNDAIIIEYVRGEIFR